MTTATISPMMQQYLDAKSAAGEALLLFRMGDFYELFYEDAKTAARVLGLTLTSRDKGENPIPMAGFPYHQLESYLGKLVSAGYRAAVCEQVEDPRQAKGLVKREVTRIVTRGTLTDEALLDPRESNYLAAIAPAKGSPGRSDGELLGMAWVELSTGRFFAATIPRGQLADQLARIRPAECLVAEEADEFVEFVPEGPLVSKRPAWAFGFDTARAALSAHFGVQHLEGFGFDDERDSPAIRAAGAVLDYLKETQKTSLEHIDRLLPFQLGSRLEIDESTRRSLELTRTMRDERRDGSLLAVLDRTRTAMGSRLLGEWLAGPLAEISAINARLDAVTELLGNASLARELGDQLAGVYDLERLLSRVITGRATPRDLSFMGRTLASLPKVKAQLTGRQSALVNKLEGELDLCPELRARLEQALEADCPLVARDGGFIRAGLSIELDGLRDLASGGKAWIARYQAEEAQRSGIPTLKVGYNKVFGYYLEITNANAEKVPAHYIRKQTIKNSERYITPELKEYEEKVVTADEKARQLEYDVFLELKQFVQSHARRLQATAAALAQLDVLVSLAELARERNYCRPTLVEEPVLEIVDGRHPVLDITAPGGTFVPNDCAAGPEAGVILLITGPNMAGKSTYIRQVALLTIMAHLGSYVPARKATIGMTDRVFARVGASDELSRGQSTFMVEMTETARILHTASEKSLVILDEIGRGTSTYDGISLAWSVVEYLHDHIGCRTLFATHYHELTDLQGSLAGVRNLNVAVREWEENVVFLHKIVPGAADKSYGIHVARLAGVPREVNERAKQILNQLEAEHLDEQGKPRIARKTKQRGRSDIQLTLFAPAEHPLLDRLRELDVNSLTPLAALALLQEWQEKLRKEKGGERPVSYP